MQTNKETIELLAQAIAEEKKRIIEELYEFQKTVSLFATSKECIAYNLALRQFADKLNAEIPDT